MLVGVNVGPNLTFSGSLATLLWRRVMHAHDEPADPGEFTRLGALTVPCVLVASTATLWLGLQSSDARRRVDSREHVGDLRRRGGGVPARDAEVTLLHVAPSDVELVAGRRHGPLGRHHHARPPLEPIADEAAQALLEEAAARLGRPAQTLARRGRVEHEVVDGRRRTPTC